MTRAKGPSPYKVYLCGGVTDCPNDPAFEHDSYYGCVPKNFSENTGRSKTHKQTRGVDGLYRWNGGCDTAPSEPTGNDGNGDLFVSALRPDHLQPRSTVTPPGHTQG